MAKKEKKFKPVTSTVMKDVNDETNQMKTFLYILIGIAIVAGLLYLVSSQYLVKDGVKMQKVIPDSEDINYDIINAGNILNRPYDEYYVLAYNPDDLQAVYYASLISDFDKKDSKMYYMNLSLDINKKYVGDVNKSATKIEELSLESPTLIKIKKNKIDKIITGRENIEKEIA